MSDNTLVLVNGSPASNIGADSRGLAYGDGVFETIRVINGVAPLLSFHIQRLKKGLTTLEINTDDRLDAALSSYFETLQSSQHSSSGKVKIIVTRSRGGKGYAPLKNMSFDAVFTFSPLTIAGWVQSPRKLKRSVFPISSNRQLAGMKHLNRLDYVLVAAKSLCDQNEELVVHNEKENVLETLHHNIFVMNNNAIRTPLLTFAGVEGVMKRVLTEKVFCNSKVKFFHDDITYDDLKSAQAIFITNALTGITPIESFEGVYFEPCERANAIYVNLSKMMANTLF